MRDTAALGHDELAARAHYPSDVLKEAENGPSLPGLPILAAYVRACDGDVPEWEERWRCLGYEPRADPSLPVRPAGTSPAAAAGARAGISIAPPDMYDPERIRAALRGQRAHADQTAQSIIRHEATAAVPGRTDLDSEGATGPESPVGWGGTANWGTDAGTGTAAGWGTDANRDPGSVWNAGASRDAASAWGAGTGQDAAAGSTSTSANGHHHAGGARPFDATVTETPGHAAGPRSARQDPFSAAWLQDSQPSAAAPDAGHGREEDRPAASGRTDFWAPPAGPGQVLPPAEEGPSLSQGAGSAASAQPQSTAKPAVQQTTAATPSEHRRDRLYPLRLLAVIVVAALIGSILVLLIR